jgi:hypothetical protein
MHVAVGCALKPQTNFEWSFYWRTKIKFVEEV